MQTADCRPGKKMQTRYKMRTADRVLNADREFILFFRLIRDNMSSYNLPSVTQSLFRDHLSRLFARFLITIVLNIISSLHIVFSLCARVGWCNVCTDFTNLIKTDVDVNKISRAIFEKQSTALHVVRTFHLLTDFMCSVC